MSESFELLLHVCVHVGVSYCHLLIKSQRNNPLKSSQPRADLGVLGVGYFWEHHRCNPVFFFISIEESWAICQLFTVFCLTEVENALLRWVVVFFFLFFLFCNKLIEKKCKQMQLKPAKVLLQRKTVKGVETLKSCCRDPKRCLKSIIAQVP